METVTTEETTVETKVTEEVTTDIKVCYVWPINMRLPLGRALNFGSDGDAWTGMLGQQLKSRSLKMRDVFPLKWGTFSENRAVAALQYWVGKKFQFPHSFL